MPFDAQNSRRSTLVMNGFTSTCENRRVDGVEAPDADVTDLVNARRDGADSQQLLEVCVLLPATCLSGKPWEKRIVVKLQKVN